MRVLILGGTRRPPQRPVRPGRPGVGRGHRRGRLRPAGGPAVGAGAGRADARDLAAFLADACHAGTAGVFNLTGTPGPFWIFIDLCKTAACSDAEPVWIPTERLVAAGVDPGMGIPLWAGEPGYDAYNDVDSSRAVAAEEDRLLRELAG